MDEAQLRETVEALLRFETSNKLFISYYFQRRYEPQAFVQDACAFISEQFSGSNFSNYHTARKSIVKVRNKLTKTLRMTKDPVEQLELILHFCEEMLRYDLLRFYARQVDNVYATQVRKCTRLFEKIHEDLQYDYEERLADLEHAMEL